MGVGVAGWAADVVVTGVGFCLPGMESPVVSADDVWGVASRGGTCLRQGEVYYGAVGLTDEEFARRVPGIPEFFSHHYTDAHRFGLVSMVEACADAQLEVGGRELAAAAVLVGRGGVDANVDRYLSVLRADPNEVVGADALELFVAAEQGVTQSDVALVQSALLRSSGPCYTVSCGCASSAVQVGNAWRQIGRGEVDVAVVTGVDTFDVALISNVQRLLRGARGAYEGMRGAGMPEVLPSFDALMRPYDRRAECINHGEGAATVVLESRGHAARRGAHVYGRVLSCAMGRDGLANPLAADESGSELVAVVRRCLGERSPAEVAYLHGGSDGNVVVTEFENSAVRELYGEDSGVLMTSQEGCFGHNGAPAGCLGVALTAMMMERGEVCPTANCEEPVEGLAFDPVPGTRTRRLDFERALTFNYQVGGVKHAVLLGRADTG